MSYTYRLTGVGSPSTVLRSDGLEFPQDPGQPAYLDYQAWLAAGHVVEAATPESLDAPKDRARAVVDSRCADARSLASPAVPGALANLLVYDEAQDWAADGSPTDSDYPLLLARVPAEGADVAAVDALELGRLATAKAWLAHVERERRAAYAAIEAATTVPELTAILAAFDPRNSTLLPELALAEAEGLATVEAARGVSFVYDTDSGTPAQAWVEYSGGDSLDLAAVDVTLCAWLRIDGAFPGTGYRGHIPFSANSQADGGALFVDATWNGSAWDLEFRHVDASLGEETFGGATVATGAVVFVMVFWDHVTGAWSGWIKPDGSSSMGVSAVGSSGRTAVTIDDVRAGSSRYSSSWSGNHTATNLIVAQGKPTAGQALAQMKSAVPTLNGGVAWLWWPLLSSTDLADQSGNSRDGVAHGALADGSMNPGDI